MPTAIEEKDAIREVLAEYCFALDGGRYDDMAALFTEDGTWDTAFGAATGRAAIAGQARDIRLKAGDNLAIEIEGLGRLENSVLDEAHAHAQQPSAVYRVFDV